MNTEKAISVIIVEDNIDVKTILSEYVNSSERFFLAGAYDNCKEAIENLKEDKPRVVLMDIDLPGMNGIQGTKKIKQLSPNTDVIIITVFENSENVFSALCAGAAGYLTKNIKKEELLLSIEQCLTGGAPMSMKIAKMVVNSFKKTSNSPLTERETEIITHLSNGKSYNSIAELLFISKDTVKYHIKNIYIKLQVDNKEDAIEVANQQRLI
jgi:DNA-binding NarL/FixJ family response regulator